MIPLRCRSAQIPCYHYILTLNSDTYPYCLNKIVVIVGLCNQGLRICNTQTTHLPIIMTVNIIQRNGQYFLQEVEAVTEFQYLEQVVAGPFDTKWKADVHRSYEYPSYRGLTDEHCRLQH